MKPFCTDREEFNNLMLCNAWVATAIIGSAVIGAGSSIFGASKAADAQKNAAAMATAEARRQYDTTRADLAPYRDEGKLALGEVNERLPYYSDPIDVTAELAKPDSVARKAYDFSLTQGLKAAQNSVTARGLPISGAALKGTLNFATGLTDNTFKTLYDIEARNRTDSFSRLKQLIDTGQTAATGTATANNVNTKIASDAAIGAGNASAAAWNLGAGATSKAFGDVGGYYAYKGLYGGDKNVGIISPTEYARGFPGGSPGSSA